MSKFTKLRDAFTGAVSSAWSLAVNPIIGQFTYPFGQLVDWLTWEMPDVPAPPEAENRSPNYGWSGKNTTAADAPVFVVLGVPRVHGALIYQGADSQVVDSSGAVDYVDPATEAEFLVAWGEGELTGIFEVTADDVPLEQLSRSRWRHYLGDATQQADGRFTTLRRYEQLTSPTVWEHGADGDPASPYPDLTASFTPAGDGATVRAHLRVQVSAAAAKTVTAQTYFTPNGGSELTGKAFTIHVPADQHGYVDVELPIGIPVPDTAAYDLVFSHSTTKSYPADEITEGYTVVTHYWWDPVASEFVINPATTTGLTYATEDVGLRTFAGGVAHQVRVAITDVAPTTAGGRSAGSAALVALVVEERLRAQALRHTAYSALSLARADLANTRPKLAARVAGPGFPVWTGSAWQTRCTNNPFWCLRGVLTSARYGANLSTAQIHDDTAGAGWGSWAAAAAACDAVVSTLDTATGVTARPVSLQVGLARGASPTGTLYQWRDGVATGASASLSIDWGWGGKKGLATLSSVTGSPTHRPGDVWSEAASGWTNYLAADAVRVKSGAFAAYAYTGLTDSAADYTGYLLDDGSEQMLCLYHDRAHGVLFTETAFAAAPSSLDVQEQRFRLDLVLDRRQSAEEWLRQILGHCRGQWWEDAGTLRVAVAVDAAETAALGPAAMLEGSFQCWEEPAAALPDALRARYWDPDQSFQRREVTVGTPLDGGRIEEVEYPGVLNPRQATRLAWTAYRLARLTWRCSFATPLATLAYEPGDVLAVSHPLGGTGWGYDVSDPDAPVPVPVGDNRVDTDLTTWTYWATVGVTDHGDGSYTLEDDQAGSAEYLVDFTGNTVAADRLNYVGQVDFLKDSDTSRFPALYLRLALGADALRNICHINTQTGAILQESAYADGEVWVTDTGTHWRVTATIANDGTRTNLGLYVMPARGTTLGTASDAATGSVRVASPALGVAGKAVRVLKVTDAGDGDARTYTCREVLAAAYSDAPGYNLPDPVRATRLLPLAPPAVENPVLTYLGDNLATDEWDPQVQLEWTHPQPALVAAVRVYDSTDDTAWRYVGTAESGRRWRWVAPLNTSGTLYARAVPVSVTGVAGALADAASASVSLDTRQVTYWDNVKDAAGDPPPVAVPLPTVVAEVYTTTADDTLTVGPSSTYATLQEAVDAIPRVVEHTIIVTIERDATLAAGATLEGFRGGGEILITASAAGSADPIVQAAANLLTLNGNTCLVACTELDLRLAASDLTAVYVYRNPGPVNIAATFAKTSAAYTGTKGVYATQAPNVLVNTCADHASLDPVDTGISVASGAIVTNTLGSEFGATPYSVANGLYLDGSVELYGADTAHHVNVLRHGADPTGVADSRAAFVAAIAAAIADGYSTVAVPRGTYTISATIAITDRHVRIVGAAGVRNDATHNGTAISFSGTGTLFRLGSTDASDWDAGLYDGTQGLYLEHLHLTTASQDTALANGLASYEAGTIAVEDWRGGHVQMKDVWIEKFETGFWGINSDINAFDRVRFLYNKLGLYLGPRSDQFEGRGLYTIGNDTALWVDGRVSEALFDRCQFVEDGSSSTPPIKIGSWSTDPSTGGRPWDIGWYGITFRDCWFERLGVNTHTVNAFIEVGSGDTLGGTGLYVERPHILALASGSGTTYFLVRADGADHIKVTDPQGVYAHNLARLVAAFGSGDPHFHVEADDTWAVGTTDGGLDVAASTGSPTFTGQFGGLNATWLASGSGRTVLDAHPYAANQRLYLSTEVADQFTVIAPNYSAGQTNRLLLRRVLDVGTRTAAPSSGTWERGDIVFNQTPAAGGSIGWVCVTGGTPGTWKTFGAIAA